jgi:hypothetical protein
VKVAYITARRPSDVARDVEVLLKNGCEKFILRTIANGAMLDRERVGAARYVAGLQAEVELEGQASSDVSTSSDASTASVRGAGAR